MLLSTQDRRLDDPLSGNALLAYRRTSIPSIEAISIASSSSSSSSAASSLHRRAPLAPLPTQPSMLDDHLSASAQYPYPTSIQDQSIPMDTDPKQDFARLIARPIVSSRRSSVHDDSMPIPPRKRSIPGQNSNRDRAAPYPASGSRSSQRRLSNTSIATASSGRRTSLPTIHAHAPQSTALHPNNSPYLLPNTADDLYSGLSSFTFGAVSYPSPSIPTDPSDMMSPHSRPSGNTSADRTPRPSVSGPSGTKPSYSKTRHGKQKAKDYLDAEMGDVEDEDEDDAARQKSRSKMRAIDDGSRRPSLPTNLYIPGSGSAPSSATIPSETNGGSSSEASPISPIQARRRSRGTGSGLDSGMDDSESDPQQGDHPDLDTDVEFDLRGSDGLPITSDASSERTFGFSHDFDHYGRPHPGHIDTSGSPSERSDQMSINEDDRDDDDDDGRGVSVSPVTFSRHDYDSEGPEVDTFYVGPEQPSPPRRSSVPWDGTPLGRESRASRTSRGSRRSRDSRDQDGSGSDTSAVVASVLNSAREREDSIATITGRRASRSVDDGLNMSAEVDPFNTFNPPNGASPSSHPQTRADFRSLEAQVLASHSYQQQLLQQLHHPPPEFDHFAQFDKFDFQQPASPLTDDDQPPPNQRIPHGGYPYDPLNAHALNPLNPLNPVEENATPTDVTNVLDGFNMDYILSGPNGSASSSSRRSWAPSMVNSFNGSGGGGGPEGRRPSTFTTASGEDAFTKHLAKNDDGYLRKRKEWSFRMESTDGKGPREFGPNPTWGAPESGVLVTVEVGSVVGAAAGTGIGTGSGSVVSAGVAGLSVPVQSMGNGGSPNVGGGGSVQAGPLTKMDKRKPMEPGTQELWKQAHVGRFKVYRLVLESEQQDKAPQQRVHVRHIIDPYSIENKRGGPQSIIHKHSRVTAFSIFRVYNLFNKASRRREPGYMSASGSILLATKEVQEHYTSTRSTVRLNSHGLLEDRPRGSSKKTAGSSSSIAGSSSSRPRRSSKSRKRNEEDGHTSSTASASGVGSSSQTNSARSTATTRTSSVSAMGKSPSRSPEPPSPQSPVVRHGLPGRVHAQGDHAMSMSMSSTVTDPFASPVESSNPHSSPSPPHVSTNNSSGSGSGSSTSAKASSSEMTRTSTSTTLSLTTTTTSSTPASRTLTNSTTSTSSPNRRMELDDEQPPPRTSHAEAFATIDSAYLEYMRGKPDRVHQDDPSNHGFVGLFRRRLLGQSAGKATSKPPSAGPNPAVLEGNYTPPWLTMAPRSKQEERERVIQTLNESFKDVGLLPSFKPQRSNNPKHKPRKHASSTNIFMNVPSESVYMLLPLWPGETDPASAEQDEDPASYIVHIEDRQYLLVYYVPFQDDPKKKKGDKKRTRAETHAAPAHSSSQKPPHINLSSFRVCARLVCYSDLRETGVRLPDYGLSITGSMTEAVQFLPPKSIRDKALDDVIIGVCHSRMDGMEFLTEGLTVLGLCKPPETEPVLPVREEDPIEDLEALLTPIGRSAVEMAWLGCMALTCF